jgi:hypothetical protein
MGPLRARLVAMDSLLCPPMFISVAYISDGEDDGSVEAAASKLLADRDSLDAVAFSSDGTDILEMPGAYRAMKALKPARLKSMVVTEGRDRAALDDLMGAGYADMAMIRICGRISEDQKVTLGFLEDYGYWYGVTAEMVPRITDESAMREIAAVSGGCKKFLIRAVDPARNGMAGVKPFEEKEVRSLVRSVNGLVRNPTFLGFI